MRCHSFTGQTFERTSSFLEDSRTIQKQRKACDKFVAAIAELLGNYNMCQSEETREEKEQFVQSAVKKQQRNKRKREPNMCVAAVLECTVRRLGSEACSQSSCFRVCRPKRRKLMPGDSKESKNPFTHQEPLPCDKKPLPSISVKEIELFSTTNFAKANSECCTASTFEGKHAMSEKPQCVPDGEEDLDAFLRDLTSEFAELPSFENVEELIRELEGDSTWDILEDEIESLLNTSDHFQPGLLEVLFT